MKPYFWQLGPAISSTWFQHLIVKSATSML
jgi:hypothetical protein